MTQNLHISREKFICKCGYPLQSHQHNNAPSEVGNWNDYDNTMETATDAFGEVCFIGENVSSMAKVTNITYLQLLDINHNLYIA